MFVQQVPTYNLSKATRTAMQRYGIEKCLKAYEDHTVRGCGASEVSGFRHSNIGDAMINAGREMVTGKREG